MRKKWFVLLVGGVIGFGALCTAQFLLVNPPAVGWPRFEHAHLRLQLIVGGEPVNFGDEKFQKGYNNTICTDELSEDPIHFHDRKDQYVHLHWKGMTGGLILKNYGWNLVGGPGHVLGYRLDRLPQIAGVPVYGNVLPSLPAEARLWVYTGDETGYQQRTAADFLRQDIETFLSKQSTIGNQESAWFEHFFVARAVAHTAQNNETNEQRATRINNVLGNIVVFVQPMPPSDQEVQERFANLEPIPESSCGG